ncbi:hypothetical protein Gasu2_42060 [Galdieria sulphuraria]|uniref:Uncharacterized protein n=1 Tax=Galdieria sulphuraria TaxID=130081 RepID=M2X828_GALSU|nr:uncharacterized protein Gasu_63520 [Galdieria sulphuraria]EME25992.1 hypothetical protein Gasu_63520 [Galdieria sulphuraria]GJD09986.1 hypothetical protein Gasu2_42060 [Galdieria sulphuraria]|eukprot:XP_005702512.1 hypothetical protein Gasu_63520 [Galdieria sulphuraria]
MEEQESVLEKDCFMQTSKGMLYGLAAGVTYGVIYNFVSEFENDLREKALERYGHLVQRFSKPPVQFNAVSNLARYSLVGASTGALLLGGSCVVAHLRNKESFFNGLIASGLAGIPFAINSGVVRNGFYASGFLALCHTLLSLQGGRLVVNNGETVFKYEPK